MFRSANTPEEHKSKLVLDQEEHLRKASTQRSYFTATCESAKQTAIEQHLSSLSPHPPNSFSGAFHYSFDFAQQMLYPSDPMQPGPMYFLVPRRCQLFGIHAEGVSKQINYLIDEAVNCGKGANVVISLLHHFFQNFGFGESHVSLHADNCTGQNKNNYVLWYFAWRCMLGLHTQIDLCFMLAGHTKFSPDWAFGLLKRLFRRTRVSSLMDITNVVECSSVVNKACFVGNETGDIYVPMYDWVSFLSPYFHKVVHIKKYHNFKFQSLEPGVVYMKEFENMESVKFSLLSVSSDIVPRNLPDEIVPAGLTHDRQMYLYKYIREFCDEETKDLVCPRPHD